MNKLVKVMCKVLEIMMWMATATMALGTILSIAVPTTIVSFFGMGNDGSTSLSINGIEGVVLNTQNGSLIQSSAIILFAGSIITFSLTAMIFRNIYLVFKLSEGNSKHSKGATPFQPDNVRMIREIGIFAISIPLVQIVMSIIAQLVSGLSGDLSVSMNGIVFGIIILALSRFFQHGADLENDTAGLI